MMRSALRLLATCFAAVLIAVWPTLPVLAQTTTISGLPSAAALNGTEVIPLNQNGVTKQASIAAFEAYVLSQLVSNGNFPQLPQLIGGDCSTPQIGSVVVTCPDFAARSGKSLLDYVGNPVDQQAIAAGAWTGSVATITGYLQAALNACKGASYAPAILTIPAGTYPIGDIINPTGNNYCQIRAYGAYFQKQLNDGAAVFTINGDYVTLEGGFFDANGMGTSISPGVGIVGSHDTVRHVRAANSQTHAFYFLGAQYPTGEDLEGYNSAGGAGVDLSGVYTGTFRHLRTHGNGKEGVAVDNGTTYTLLDGVETFGNGLTGALGGIGSGASGNYNTIVNVLSHDNNAWCVGLQGIHTKLSHLTCYGNHYGGVYFEGFDSTNHPDANHQGDLGYDTLSDSFIAEGFSQSFTGSLVGGATGQLTVTAGTVIPGQWLGGNNVPSNLQVVSQVSGATNGPGVYTLSGVVNNQVPSEAMTAGTGPAVQIDGVTALGPAVPGISLSNVDHPFGLVNDLGGITTILDSGNHVVYEPGAGGGFASNFVARGFNASIAWLTGGAGADANLWDAITVGSTFRFRAVNDANTAANAWLDVLRTGNAPTLGRFYVPLSEPLATPASSAAACTAGTFQDDANYHYVCVATNTWKRIALSSF